MFERFTGEARRIVVQAQEDARRLGHGYIGPEHMLLAVASTGQPVSAVLRDHGVTPERVEAELLRIAGGGHPADLLGDLDREALAAIGIDLDAVRDRLETAFGRDALARPLPGACRSRRPAWAKGPVAELMRRRQRRQARRHAPASGPASGPVSGPAGAAHGRAPLPTARAPRTPGQGVPPRGHIPFTPRAKKSLERSLRQAKAMHDDYIGVQHVALALLALDDGLVPPILSALGVSRASLRAAILNRYRQAS